MTGTWPAWTSTLHGGISAFEPADVTAGAEDSEKTTNDDQTHALGGAEAPDGGSRPERAARPGDPTPADETTSFSSKRTAVLTPALGLRGSLLFLWRQLTSMQTALILLMLMAIAAVPGSLYPQRSVNPNLTEQFLEENGRWGEILDALGFFEVFSSPWFSAI